MQEDERIEARAVESMRIKAIGMLALLTLILCACSQKTSPRVSTPEDRAALLDYIVAKTLKREAFSSPKNRVLDLDVEKEMLRFREEMIAADTDDELFAVLLKVSAARKDRHLQIGLVEGGLKPEDVSERQAPIRFRTDFKTPGDFLFFVSDFAADPARYRQERRPEVGDVLLGVNGMPIKEYFSACEPYHRYSTANGLWWKFAEAISMRTYRIPPTLKHNTFRCLLLDGNGGRYEIDLPYVDLQEIVWQGHDKGQGEDRYPGFTQVYSVQCYDLYRHDEGRKVLLLDWYGFREDLIQDVDALISYASENDCLEHAVIFDATRSRGGSRGAYVIQRLRPKPFKTTFGNLRISDITMEFIESRRSRYSRRSREDSDVTETVGDDDTWLLEWLNEDVARAVEEKKAYSNDVPFKLAHLPKDSDGILQPAELHFRGPLICFFSPHGGSHLDQFAAMIVDNRLGYTMGMPPGGYSNTWEWEEILVFPHSGQPVASFMWSIGHTLRPNGEVLEGNPAQVDDFLPLTRENFLSYYEILLSRALEYLETIDENI
jgi:hypothetical protein